MCGKLFIFFRSKAMYPIIRHPYTLTLTNPCFWAMQTRKTMSFSFHNARIVRMIALFPTREYQSRFGIFKFFRDRSIAEPASTIGLTKLWNASSCVFLAWFVSFDELRICWKRCNFHAFLVHNPISQKSTFGPRIELKTSGLSRYHQYTSKQSIWNL